MGQKLTGKEKMGVIRFQEIERPSDREEHEEQVQD
jgi:hypothetical protein